MAKSSSRAQAIERFRKASQAMSRPSVLMRTLIADRAGLNPTDAECIDYLLSSNAATASDLTKATNLSKSAITTVLQRLERAGYISREPDPDDRRKTRILANMLHIQKQFGPYYAAVTHGFHDIVAGYSIEDLALLTYHYKQMTQLYETQVEHLSDPTYRGVKD